MNTQEQRLHDRIEARKYAELCPATITPDPGQSDLWLSVFWETIRKAIPVDAALAETSGTAPMTDREAMMFSHAEMTFGKHRGIPICHVPLTYLDWLVGQPDDFRQSVARYLANPRVAAELAAQVGTEDEGE